MAANQVSGVGADVRHGFHQSADQSAKPKGKGDSQNQSGEVEGLPHQTPNPAANRQQG
jgi:hypothetical protein